MNQKQFLSELKVPERATLKEHAGKILQIPKFLNSIKADIVISEITGARVPFQFGRKVEISRFNSGEIRKTVLDSGEPLTADEFTVLTSTGEYKFKIPVESEIHTEVCKILNIEAGKVEIENLVIPDQSFRAGPEFIGALKKAAKFVGKDDLRPGLKCVLVEVYGGVGVVVATDCFTLYNSGKISFPGVADLKILIPGLNLSNLKDSSEVSRVKIFEKHIEINGQKFELDKENKFPDWKFILPNYQYGVTVDKKEFVRGLKGVTGGLHGVTKRVDIDISDSIKLHAEDVDWCKEADTEVKWKTKTVTDFYGAFNRDFLLKAVTSLNTDTIQIETDGARNKIIGVTDGTEKVYIMPYQREAA